MRWIIIVIGLLAATSVWARPAAEDMLAAGGAPISLTGWGYRKKIEIKADGVQQLDLDLETLARAASDLRDMRIVRDGQQYPYVTEHADKSRRYAPIVDAITDAKRPTMSIWRIHLPAEGAPVTRIVCQTRAPLFDRQVTLSETTDDGRRFLGSAHWVRTPYDASKTLVLSLSDRPVTDSLVLEMDNGDNPGIALDNFQCEFPTVRLLFRAPTMPETFLYYGNPQAVAPSYDLALVAPQLRVANRLDASLAGEEPLRPRAGQMTSAYAWLFWVVLAAVAVVLLVVIARMLPKSPTA
jgi:hypothetical protein